MKSSPLKKKHRDKLTEYSINDLVKGACECWRYKAGETIVREGMPFTSLLIVVTGKAKVCSTGKNGKDLILCCYISDGILGDIELMTNTYVSTASIIAITDFECIALPCQRYAVILKNDPGFLNKIGQALSAKLLQSSKNLVSTALYSGEERLCAYILQTAHHDVFNDVMTDVSGSIGMSYRHMFRLLNQLCTDGLLEKRDHGYLIVDRDELIRRSAEFIE